MKRFLRWAVPGWLCIFVFAAPGDGLEAEEVSLDEIEMMDAGDPAADASNALTWNKRMYAPVDRAISVPLPRTVRKGYLQYVIEHRNRTPVDENTFDNFAGFDGGNLKIGLGMNYGLLDNLDVGVYRLNGTVEKFDTWQFSGKWQVLSEMDSMADAAVVGGGTLYTIKDADDDSGGFGSILLGRSMGTRVYGSVGGLYHSNSSSAKKTAANEDDSTAVLGSVVVHVTPSLYLAGEVSTPVAGFEADNTAWAGGLKFATHGHTFSLVAGNTQYISLDGFAAGTDFKDDEIVLGFSITRDVRLPGRLGEGLF